MAVVASPEDAAAPRARKEGTRNSDRAGRGAPTGSRGAPGQAAHRKRMGWIFESDDARTRVASLAWFAAHRAPRKRHQSVPSRDVARSSTAAFGSLARAHHGVRAHLRTLARKISAGGYCAPSR